MEISSSKKNIIWITGGVIAALIVVGLIVFFLFKYVIKLDKASIAVKSLSAIERVSSLLPISSDAKKELSVVNKLVEEFTKQDDVEKSFLVLLQNNMELRPGGGFLGQYAILKVKNGKVTSTFVEDANLLDQRIEAKIAPPYPLTRMMQIKKWKFRDSNFSPDFPTNAEKAKYFYRLSGRSNNFDGVIGVNTQVLTDILKLIGPITVPGYAGEYTSENVVLKLEEQVEKSYLLNSSLDTTYRKTILKKMAPIIIDKLFQLNNITKLAEFAHNEMKEKNIMLSFKDTILQELVNSVYWGGKVSQDWSGDYLMIVDANMGSLKTDYYMRRDVTYEIDFTGEKPIATLWIKYRNTAPYGDWRTSDYHSYLRVYAPKGSVLLEREMVGAPITNEDLGKTCFGFIEHTVMGTETNTRIKYELPAEIRADGYRLLVQKQSGIGNLPLTIRMKTKEKEFTQETTLTGDLKFEFKTQ